MEIGDSRPGLFWSRRRRVAMLGFGPLMVGWRNGRQVGKVNGDGEWRMKDEKQLETSHGARRGYPRLARGRRERTTTWACGTSSESIPGWSIPGAFEHSPQGGIGQSSGAGLSKTGFYFH